MSWPTNSALAELVDLAAENNLTVHWKDGMPTADPQRKVVKLNPPTSGERYLSGLHEIGHCVDPMAVVEERRLTKSGNHREIRRWFLMEAAAWSWALQHVHPELRPLIRSYEWTVAANCLFSYGLDLADHSLRGAREHPLLT